MNIPEALPQIHPDSIEPHRAALNELIAAGWSLNMNHLTHHPELPNAWHCALIHMSILPPRPGFPRIPERNIHVRRPTLGEAIAEAVGRAQTVEIK